MKFEPTVLRVEYAMAEVQLPASGIMLTFRCMSKTDISESSMLLVARMLSTSRLTHEIRFSAGSLQSAKRVAAEAIRTHRLACEETRSRRRKPWQLSFFFW
ncbi:MAG: hypothetical protein WAZ27_05200 [Minisyncoccia bacterium]